MFFGLTNSPVTFQMMMNDIFRDMIAEGVVCVYLDDILIFTKTLSEHRMITQRVLECLQEYNLCLKPEKCKFECTQIEYVSRSNHLGRNSRDGPSKGVRSFGVAGASEQKGSPVLCQICKFLPTVHQAFLSPCVCPVRPHQKGCWVAMGGVGTSLLRQT